MKKLILIAMIIGFNCFATEIGDNFESIKYGKETYKDCKITAITPAQISISHGYGIVNLWIHKLEKAFIDKNFPDYDIDKAKLYEKKKYEKKVAQNAARVAQLKKIEASRIKLRIDADAIPVNRIICVQNLNKGFLAKAYWVYNSRGNSNKSVFIYIDEPTKSVDNEYVFFFNRTKYKGKECLFRIGNYQYTTALGSVKTIRKYTASYKKYKEYWASK